MLKHVKLLGLIIATILLSLLITLPTYLGISFFDGHIFLKLLTTAVTFLAILALLSFWRRRLVQDTSVHPPLPMTSLIIWTLASLLLEMASNLVFHWLGFGTSSGNNDNILKQLHSPNFAVMLLSLHVVGPILEEYLFRGIVLEKVLIDYPKHKGFALFLSAFLFAYSHTYNLSPSLLSHMISGLLFSYLYQQSRALRYPILSHILTNSLISLLHIILGHLT